MQGEDKVGRQQHFDFKFVCSIVIWYDILFKVNMTSKSISFDLLHAVAQLATPFLKDYRSYAGFAGTLASAKELAEKLEIEPCFAAPQPRIRKRQFSYGGRNEPVTDPAQCFKVVFFNQILGCAI